jgi:TRAP-type mannitol/chloroaromatic compound transport system substrate-binding protein
MRLIGRLVGIAAAGAVALGAGSAAAQDKKVRVQMQSNFASTLALLGPNANFTVDQIKKLSNGSIDIKFFEPGALVPPGQAFDSVASGALDMAWATPGYWTGKDIAFAVFSTVPFGPGLGEYLAWMKQGGGEKMMQDLYAKYNIHSVMCHLIPPEASGWFRKEIKTLADVKGLKIRFAGLGGKVMQKAGASVTVLPAAEIFPALEKGAIDATEFSMPAIDEKLGFDKLVKNYYFPGWHQVYTAEHLLVNKDIWNKLSKGSKTAIDTACTAGVMRGLAKGEFAQIASLKNLKAKGVVQRDLPEPVLKELMKITDEVMAGEAAANADFKKVYESQKAFLKDYRDWKTHAYMPRSW